MDKLRLCYEQTGRGVWASHLDVMRTLQRALNRCNVPIKYSEGFNPHAQISILMPLSVGTASRCQYVDIRVKEDVNIAELPQQLTAVMPEGFAFTDCYEEGRKVAEMKWLQVEGTLEYDNRSAVEAAEKITKLFEGNVIVQRRTKRGEGPFEMCPHMRNVSFTPEGNEVKVSALLSCAEPVVNPDLIPAAIAQNLPEWAPDGAHFCRLAVFTEDNQLFR